MIFKDVFKRKMNQLGAEMVEYAIVLACIAAVGVSFYSTDGNLAQVLGNTFNKVVAIVDGSGSSNSGKNLLGDFNLNSGSRSNLKETTGTFNDKDRLHTDIYAIEPNSSYEIRIDTSKMTMPDGHPLEVGFFVTDADGTTNMNNSGWISTIKDSKKNGQYVSEVKDNITTIKFTTGADSARFAMNFRATSDANFTADNPNINSELKNAISLVKTGTVK